jgi:hypothetical protein
MQSNSSPTQNDEVFEGQKTLRAGLLEVSHTSVRHTVHLREVDAGIRRRLDFNDEFLPCRSEVYSLKWPQHGGNAR